ncbi:MAG: tRNA (guanosine(37)-N1)-methyltransferase TrmD [Prolixibacteraceae bacterium]|nr:tRNA (guanosine(37)-N1)-methyltransferase TrmD [Prolixibacteraceae bacterium]
MRIDILTLFPGLFESPFQISIIKRAVEKRLCEIHLHDIRDYSTDKHKSVDDYAFGGGAGMVMMIQPIEALILKLKAERNYDEIIYMTPDAKVFTQKEANRLSMSQNLMILCGHYKGVDQRIRDHYITHEISIGDYVLTGGELAAAVVVDSVVRLIPGVLSDETSALTDSHQDGLLSPPVYTRPANYKGWEVPGILLSGNEKKINEWRENQSMEITRKIRPDLFDK